MKLKLLAALCVVLAAAVVIFLVVRPGAEKPGDAGEGSGAVVTTPEVERERRGGASQQGEEPTRTPVRPGTASGGVAAAESPDAGRRLRDAAPDPKEPPYAEKLAAEALVRQLDAARGTLGALKARVPRLKSVLQRLQSSGGATAEQVQQIQTQVQQTADAISRLEKQLPELEAQVAKLKATPAAKDEKNETKQPAP